jgi:hypothetical protein
MPFARLKMSVAQFISSERPIPYPLPEPFRSKTPASAKQPAARFRLTVDGNSEEFWVKGFLATPDARPRRPEIARVAGQGRSVTLSMPADFVDLGFNVELHRFERQLDPGTDQPSHYTSVVSFHSEGRTNKLLKKDVRITMNAPVDFAAPDTRTSFRLFQESYQGPFPPSSLEYRSNSKDPQRRELYASILTVNNDPGRGIKYAGCLLIVSGIATMFYMRAYFFAPRPAQDAAEHHIGTTGRKSLKAGRAKPVGQLVE